MQPRFHLSVSLLLTAALPAHAGTLDLEGDFLQGGLVIGRTAPPARVQVDGKVLKVSKSGLFVVGFDRDAKPKAMLRAIFSDGSVQSRRLTIRQREYRISRINGLAKRKVAPTKLDMKRIRREYGLINKARRRFTATPWFREGFVWPVTGRISGVFGSQRILNGKPRRPHAGIDVAAPEGTPVRAAAGGVVALAEPDLFFTGGTMIIDHGFGVTSIYAHLKTLHAAKGDKVRRGDIVAEVGMTGRATGPHLHWGMSLHRTRLDPGLLVGPMPKKTAAAAR